MRHEGNGYFLTLFILEFLARPNNPRVIMAESKRAEAAKEIENGAAVLIIIIHAFRAVDFHLVKTEKLHEMQLTGIEMPGEKLGHARQRHGLGLFDREQIRLSYKSLDRLVL